MSGPGRIMIGGLSSGMDTDSMIRELMKVQNMKVDRFRKKNMWNEYRQEEWKKMNSKLYSFYSKDLTQFRMKTNYVKFSVKGSHPSVAEVSATGDAQRGSHELEVLALAKSARTASSKLQTALGGEITKTTTLAEMGISGDFNIAYEKEGTPQSISVSVEATDTLETFAKKIKDAAKGNLDLDVNADIKNGYLFLASKETGSKQKYRLSGDAVTAMGFSTGEVQGSDAKYRYNGIEMTSESNVITVNGIKATLHSQGTTNITVEKSVDEAYKQVTDFIKKYNALALDLHEKVNVTVQRSQRDMQPLTSEEKKGMSEADVKKWEETLRGRVFKNDKNVKGIIQDMRTSMTGTFLADNGQYSSLADLGISVGKYGEGVGGMLFVDGDSELGGKRVDLSNKLRKALEDDPDAVANLLTKLGDTLSEKMSERMRGSSLRSYMSFYDDKAVKEEYKEMEKKIQGMEDRMEKMEDRYRKQFLAMEQAIAKSNSISSWLSQQLSGLR